MHDSTPDLTSKREPANRPAASSPPAWTVQDASDLYGVEGWGQGHYAVGPDGHLHVASEAHGTATADIVEIVEGLRERGLESPLLIRFPHILRQQLRVIHQCFQDAIAENDYRGGYVGAFPMKVNSHRHVVEQVFSSSEDFGFGLEVGSMPELLAAIALTSGHNDRLIICNGFKDEGFIEAVMMAVGLGRKIVTVIDNFSEVTRLVECARRRGVRPTLGVRIKLSSQGTGRWRDSAGSGAKFGLSVIEVLEVIEILRREQMLDCLNLIHCHVGSQVEDIRSIKDSVDELAMLFVQISRLGATLNYIDIGGGLGIDYDGSKSNKSPSVNYTIEEYASSVIYRFATAADNAGLEHPTIISESGRAMVAHSSLLVFEIIGSSSPARAGREIPTLEQVEKEHSKVEQPIRALYDSLELIDPDRLAESFHDATHAYRSALELFNLGHLEIKMRGLAERLYWACLVRLQHTAQQLEEPPAELEEIDMLLSEIYFGNFSVFQSLPDTWGIDQVFPIMPIQRLGERPSVKGIIADVTCDSDGKISRFIGDDGVSSRIALHPLRQDETYFIGAFLVGAYQEALGDLFNLFGDTNVAQVEVDPDGSWQLGDAVLGDTSREVLSYIEYDADDLYSRVMRDCQTAIREGRLSPADSRAWLRFYKDHLDSYTYLE